MRVGWLGGFLGRVGEKGLMVLCVRRGMGGRKGKRRGKGRSDGFCSLGICRRS